MCVNGDVRVLFFHVMFGSENNSLAVFSHVDLVEQ